MTLSGTPSANNCHPPISYVARTCDNTWITVKPPVKSYTLANWELPNRRNGTANTWEGPQILTGHWLQKKETFYVMVTFLNSEAMFNASLPTGEP